jgi:peptide/nickel transport system substrate-binding protein
MIQAMLRQIGINAKTQVLTYPAAVQAAREGQHNMIPQAVSASDPDILRTFFHSRNIAAGLNWSKFGDADLDQWLDDAVRTSDPVRRAQLYEKIQKKIMDEALIIPIRDYVNLNVASVRVKGLRYSLQGWFPWIYDVYVEP